MDRAVPDERFQLPDQKHGARRLTPERIVYNCSFRCNNAGTLSNRGDALGSMLLMLHSILMKRGGKEMRKLIAVLVIVAMAVVGMAGAANYMYEKASIKGVGYKNVEMIISTRLALMARSW